jgi:hypothetical protein
MHRSGFEPELLSWKAKVIAARPSARRKLNEIISVLYIFKIHSEKLIYFYAVAIIN